MSSLFCPSCAKEIIIYAMPPGAVSNEDISQIHTQAEKENKLVLFNPPPFLPYKCPVCGTDLVGGENKK